MKQIFIATNTHEIHNTEEVIRLLRKAGHKPIIYNANEVFAGRKSFTYEYGPSAKLPVVHYDGQLLSAETIGAAWYWRPNGFLLNCRRTRAA